MPRPFARRRFECCSSPDSDLTSVVAFGAFAVVNVQRRLARPMKILTAAIARLSRREFDEPVPVDG